MRREPSPFDDWLRYMEEITEPVPKSALQRVVCPCCDGEGRYVNPAIDGNGISAEEWGEWTDESRENYLTGVYDVVCEECGGENVVLRLRDDAPLRLRLAWENWEEEVRVYRAVDAAERRMGA